MNRDTPRNSVTPASGPRSVAIDRRRFSALLLSPLLTTFCAATAEAQSPFQAPAMADSGKRRKNVLLLMADQHRPAALGINGNTPARTPRLDALASGGVRFDHAYCTSPASGLSRASLLTGLWPHHHGVDSDVSSWPYMQKTIAHYFHRAGYITALVGKMQFADGQTHGFDYHLDFNDWLMYLGPKAQLFADEIGEHPAPGSGLPQIGSIWKQSGDPWTRHVLVDDRKGSVALGGMSKLEERDHFESFVTRESIRFLKNYSDDGPFFLAVSYLKPHEPFTPATRYFHQFSPDDMQLPGTLGKVDRATLPAEVRTCIERDRLTPELQDPANARRRVALYYASLMQTDANIGRMLDALKELGLEEDTIVLYTSDRGDMLGEHGLWQRSFFYEQSAGVPLVVRAPGVTPAGVRSATPVSQVSIAPMLLELCELPLPAGLDGGSLVPDLREPAHTRDTKIYAEFDWRGPGAKAMVRAEGFKYIRYAHDTPDELYNLSNDPEEMHNLIFEPQFADRVAKMKDELLAWHQPCPPSTRIP